MMKGMLGGLLVAIGLGWGMPAAAQETQEREAAEKFMGSLTFREGEISVPDADATFRLTPRSAIWTRRTRAACWKSCGAIRPMIRCWA